jgi:hypothetical protein
MCPRVRINSAPLRSSLERDGGEREAYSASKDARSARFPSKIPEPHIIGPLHARSCRTRRGSSQSVAHVPSQPAPRTGQDWRRAAWAALDATISSTPPPEPPRGGTALKHARLKMADEGTKKEVEGAVGLEGRAYEALEKDFSEVGLVQRAPRPAPRPAPARPRLPGAAEGGRPESSSHNTLASAGPAPGRTAAIPVAAGAQGARGGQEP